MEEIQHENVSHAKGILQYKIRLHELRRKRRESYNSCLRERSTCKSDELKRTNDGLKDKFESESHLVSNMKLQGAPRQNVAVLQTEEDHNISILTEKETRQIEVAIKNGSFEKATLLNDGIMKKWKIEKEKFLEFSKKRTNENMLQDERISENKKKKPYWGMKPLQRWERKGNM